MPRYLVIDDEGQPLRRFYCKADAVRFLLPGYKLQITPKPKTQKFDLSQIEAAPY